MHAATTKDLIAAFQEESQLSKKEAKEYFGLFIELSSDFIAESGLDISGFGKFVLKETNEKEHYIPTFGRKITIPAKKKIVFKPDKALKDRL